MTNPSQRRNLMVRPRKQIHYPCPTRYTGAHQPSIYFINRFNLSTGTRSCRIQIRFIPNSQDTAAWRMRRRYRLHKGGHPQLVLIHYYRVPLIRKSLHHSIITFPFSPPITHGPIYIWLHQSTSTFTPTSTYTPLVQQRSSHLSWTIPSGTTHYDRSRTLLYMSWATGQVKKPSHIPQVRIKAVCPN
jgi:hypothetical protein